MGEIRVHRGDPARFVKIPNDTARDTALSWAARGYLAEILSRPPDWQPETADDAAGRAQAERGKAAEVPYRVRVLFAELERAGYRHRVIRRGPGGVLINETHYYDVPSRPCPDRATCKSCITAGGTDRKPARGR